MEMLPSISDLKINGPMTPSAYKPNQTMIWNEIKSEETLHEKN